LDLLDTYTLIQLVTKINHSDIVDSHTLLLAIAHIESVMASLGVAWKRIPTISSASGFHGSDPLFLAAGELLSLTAGPRLSSQD
jgi:hypothetical protein